MNNNTVHLLHILIPVAIAMIVCAYSLWGIHRCKLIAKFEDSAVRRTSPLILVIIVCASYLAWSYDNMGALLCIDTDEDVHLLRMIWECSVFLTFGWYVKYHLRKSERKCR